MTATLESARIQYMDEIAALKDRLKPAEASVDHLQTSSNDAQAQYERETAALADSLRSAQATIDHLRTASNDKFAQLRNENVVTRISKEESLGLLWQEILDLDGDLGALKTDNKRTRELSDIESRHATRADNVFGDQYTGSGRTYHEHDNRCSYKDHSTTAGEIGDKN